jgi:L-lactate dehydrogenase complex protein LldG
LSLYRLLIFRTSTLTHTLENLGVYLKQFEARRTAAGGTVHWAVDAAEGRQIILELLRQENASEVVKIKTMTSVEIQLNPFRESGGKHVIIAPEGLSANWLASGFDWKIDHNLAIDEIEQADGVVTASFCSVADSGTIVLHHSATEGRRVLTLLPDWHLCILRASQVVETLPEYFDRLQELPPLATFISGPSATADIEMTCIKGVHGPRFLHVILVRD